MARAGRQPTPPRKHRAHARSGFFGPAHACRSNTLDELFKSFEQDDPGLSAILEALAFTGTAAALETLRVIEFRLASRVPELRAELACGDRSSAFVSQLMRGECLPAREEFLKQLRHAIQCIASRPEPLPMNVKENILAAASATPESISTLLSRMEDDKLEFKAALRWDPASKAIDEKLERRVLQTVAGFANAAGGTLLIGVNPDRKVIGLERDYASLKGDSDLFERHLRQLFQGQLGKAVTILNVKISFHEIGGMEICRVDVEPVSEPVFTKSSGREAFYVRNGNATVPLEGGELAKYLKRRFRS